MASFFGKLLKRKAVSTAPDQFDLLYKQATAAAQAHDFPRALQFYDHAIALNPSHAEAHYKRGNVLKNLGRLDAALASYDQAIAHKPDYSYAYCNRGTVQQALGLMAEALSSYDQAIALDHRDSMAHNNRALLMQSYSRWDEALASYDRAISVDPTFADAQYNRAMALLFCGNFEPGWSSYEWRWKNAQRLGIGESRHFSQPLWLGQESIKGKLILLHSEGGLGDTLHFCRYASQVAALGATVYLEVQAPLLDLLTNLEGVSQLIALGSVLPPFDYHCPLMSLPLAFKTTLKTIPADSRYLHSDQSMVIRWRSLLQEEGGPCVGLVWSGNPNNAIDSRRSIPLADWLTHLPVEFRYFCLQKDVREDDRKVLRSSPLIHSFNDGSLDFPNTAALCDCMDIVISVDTSVAHLSAALGRRTWILLPDLPDWRWLRDREDSPWYPTAKLYRQTKAGDWNDVFARIASDLRREFRAD